MQIPSNVLSKFSAKGKGYVEAGLKMAQGYRLIEEAQLELDHLDGKARNRKKGAPNNAGGDVVTEQIVDLVARKMAPEAIVARAVRLLKSGDKSTGELAVAIGCSTPMARAALVEGRKKKLVVLVGSGNQVRWSLRPARSVRKKTLANKVLRRKSPTGKSKTARVQSKCEAADPAQQKKDEDKILELLQTTPGLSVGPLMKKLGRSFYPVQRALKSLIAQKRLKPIKVETKNGRKLDSWEPA